MTNEYTPEEMTDSERQYMQGNFVEAKDKQHCTIRLVSANTETMKDANTETMKDANTETMKDIREMRELVKKLGDLVNVMGSEQYLIDAFVEAFDKQHRTIQADTITVLLKGLFKWAKEAVEHHRIDPRNAFAIKVILSRLGSAGEEALDSMENITKKLHDFPILNCHSC